MWTKKLPGVLLRVGGKVNTAIQVLILFSDDKDLEVGRLSPLSREKGEIAIAYLERWGVRILLLLWQEITFEILSDFLPPVIPISSILVDSQVRIHLPEKKCEGEWKEAQILSSFGFIP